MSTTTTSRSARRRRIERQWFALKAAFLGAHPTCARCGRPAIEIARPPGVSRQVLLERVTSPEVAAELLTGLCAVHRRRRTDRPDTDERTDRR